MATAATIPMIAPDGTTGDIPQDKLEAATKAGFKRAVEMTSPSGEKGYIPFERQQEAMSAGFKPNSPAAEQSHHPTLDWVNQHFANNPGEGKPGGYDEALRPIGNIGRRAVRSLVGGITALGDQLIPEDTQKAGEAQFRNSIDGRIWAGEKVSGKEIMADTLDQIIPGLPIGSRPLEFARTAKHQGLTQATTDLAGDALAAYGTGKAMQGVMNGAGAVSDLHPVQAAKAGVAKAQVLGSKLVPGLIDGPPESLMTRAIKPGKNNVGWNQDIQRAGPLMKSAEAKLGRSIQGVDDALEAAVTAKKDIWDQYQKRLEMGGRTGATIDGNEIAKAMLSSIDTRTAVHNPGLINRIRATAETYRRPLSLAEAEDFLQSANKDLHNYYAKNKVGRQVALNDPEMSSTVAEAEALRRTLQAKLDRLTGPGAYQLKQAYGALSNVEKELYGRQLVNARQNPESLSEQMSTVHGAGKIAKGIFTASPGDVIEGAQGIAVSKAIKARNSSDAMLERAFQKLKPAKPFPMPSLPRFAGLLERGPLITPAPEASASPTTQPPPFNYTTRAQRKGLLLPEQAGGNVLPYNPEMSADEKLVALMHALRQTKQKALPAKAQPIRLPKPRD